MSDQLKTLLQRVNGFDFGEGIFAFAKNKILATTKRDHKHVTIHFEPESRTLDIHLTSAKGWHGINHQRLFSITHENFVALLQELEPSVIQTLKSILRPLRLGWVARNRIKVIFGLIPMDSDLFKVATVRHRKIMVDPERLASNSTVPEFLEELYELADWQSFTLFRFRKSGKCKIVGVGFKSTNENGEARLMWLPYRRINKAMKLITKRVLDAAAKYGIFHKPLPWF